MQKTFMVLGAMLMAAVTIQSAAASGRHHIRKVHPAPITQSVREFQRGHLAIAADRAGLVAVRQRRPIGTGGTVI